MKTKILLFVTVLTVAAAGLFLVKPRAVRADGGCDATSLTGAFGYSMSGYFYDQQGYVYYLASTGRISSDGNGALTGAETLSFDGQGVIKRKYTGTYTMNADCTGSAQLSVSDGVQPLGSAVDLDLVLMDSGKQMNVVQTDRDLIFSGKATKQ